MANRTLKIAILQHSDETPPGSCVKWAKNRGHAVTLHKLHQGVGFPDLRQTDILIILGGAMNVDDTDEHKWLLEEKKFLREAVAAGKPCLGLCLGGQLLAQVLGGEVTKNKHWEVGWKPVQLNGLSAPLMTFQYHQDQFSLPPGAERIATNDITLNQAFKYGDHVVGLQFHPESTEEWVRYCAREKDAPPEGTFVDSREQMVAGIQYLPAMREWFFDLLDGFEDHCLDKPTS